MTPQALVVHNRTSGIPNFSAALRVKLMTPSDTIHVTGGTPEADESLSLEMRLLKGARQWIGVYLQRAGIS